MRILLVEDEPKVSGFIVDVYVRHLRAKVDDDHDVKLIRTVRGAGYTIRAGGEA